MIKNSQRQIGSAHLVIVITLVVALIGALGFIFWQNFVKTETDTSESVTTKEIEESSETDKYADWGTYESVRDGYSIKYPKDWIIIKETDQDGPYIRNVDPTSGNTESGYPAGYINLRVLREDDSADFKARTDYTVKEWYEALGKTYVNTGVVGYEPKDVKVITFNGISAKSIKSVFTETNEVIYFLKDNTLYSINLYPYGSSSDPTVKLMLDSFAFL